ncbi:Uncharacterised protein [Capnocytophaga canimorsus]|nr:hypothetical protein CLV61_1463 [Capnocytophaga canimorsus]STA71502.1 Uncharacterised protein [Capnocytophaga canimorsus]
MSFILRMLGFLFLVSVLVEQIKDLKKDEKKEV